MTAPPNDLTSLVKLISDSVAVVTSEYAKAGHASPTLESTAQDPFRSPESVSERLKTAIKTIEAACAQLSATVASPGHVITNVSALHVPRNGHNGYHSCLLRRNRTMWVRNAFRVVFDSNYFSLWNQYACE